MGSPWGAEWTDERVADLSKMWAAGMSCSQIAKKLGGVTRNAVIGKVNRLGLGGRGQPTDPGAGNQPVIPEADIRRLVAKGLAPPQIAAELGVATYTVYNRLKALGLEARDGRRSLRAPKINPKPRKLTGLSLAAVAKADPSQRLPTAAPPPTETAIGLRLVDLGFQHCRWPLAMSESEHTFCGAQRAGEGSYCAAHHARAVSPPAPGRQRSAKELTRSLRRYI